MKTLACGDLVPGCQAVVTAETEEEILQIAASARGRGTRPHRRRRPRGGGQRGDSRGWGIRIGRPCPLGWRFSEEQRHEHRTRDLLEAP